MFRREPLPAVFRNPRYERELIELRRSVGAQAMFVGQLWAAMCNMRDALEAMHLAQTVEGELPGERVLQRGRMAH